MLEPETAGSGTRNSSSRCGRMAPRRAISASAPHPFTTIAWRICHVSLTPIVRYEYTFGDHKLTYADVVWPSTAVDCVAMLRDALFKWRNALEDMPSEELDQIGRSQNPYGLDQKVRFIDLVAWCNTEIEHHAAEIGCVRDLYRAMRTEASAK